MADKFFIFGATYNGDGTASNEAASNGAAGAWNQESILTGTAPAYGTLNAGDTVYIRSKTGNGADANKTITLSAAITLGSSAGTATSPVTWVLDNGDKWSGIDGTLTYTSSVNSYSVSLRDYNNFIAQTKHAWVLENTNAAPSFSAVFGVCYTKGLKWTQPNRVNVGIGNYGALKFDSGLHEDLLLHYNQIGTGSYAVNYLDSTLPIGATCRFNNLEVKLDVTGSSNTAIFGGSGYHCGFVIRGGRLYGAGAASNVSLMATATAASNAFHLDAVGFQVPKTAEVSQRTTQYLNNWVSVHGADGGVGAEIWASWGNADCRNYSLNYPYLNGTLPDSAASPVSWRVVPTGATWYDPAVLVVGKLYTSAAAAKTVTLNLLVSDNWAAGAIDRSTVWMTVQYVDDSTGAPVTETTRLHAPGTSLDASTASWSATSWGSVNFGTDGKRKLALTTAGSIKQDTEVVVCFHCSAKSASTVYDILIVDPDVQLS